ncbi:MAG: 4'-phosphopantetheinyl transferase superfamily protein [Holosporaceae bacterium]|jgi:4'-phosphopantetheinyl transferase|nr:4'-phosphopantetheinyl transferase superfamily protein [Holosporaceae bacterium]
MNITTLDLPFFFNKKEEKCALSIAKTSDFCWENLCGHLSEDEFKKSNSISLEKRKRQYCLGRITTKKALHAFIASPTFKEINIINAKSGCPIIENFDYFTSISHTDEVVASLVFKKGFSFGIDIESMRENRVEALKSIMSEKECISNDLKNLTAAWTLKEALSKALQCGFHMPFEEFKLSKFSENDQIFSCLYSKHPEFKGVALIYENNFYAIAYPANIEGFPEAYCSKLL